MARPSTKRESYSANGKWSNALLCAAAAWGLLAAPAFALSGKEIMMNGVGEAPACSACHGENGEGQPDSGFPRLAGLSPEYMLQQLQDLADGKRQSDVMSPVAKALSADDRKAVVAYLSGLRPEQAKPAEAADAKLVSAGMTISKDGMWSKGLPGCDQCHGPLGQGVGTTFPRLAGQNAAYIESQLHAWKDGTRKNDPLSLMKGIADGLDDDQIKAVSSYYASLDPINPAGGTQTDAKGDSK